MPVIFQDSNRTPIRGVTQRRIYSIIPAMGQRVATRDRVYHVDMVTHDIADDVIYVTLSAI